MAGFFKKALGVFVEFEDENKNTSNTTTNTNTNIPSNNQIPTPKNEVVYSQQHHAEAEKFEKYFDQLFDKANLPGPDYYEFFKTMETLEAHIHDEKARLSATFASLSIQGLTKEKLITTATQYKEIMENDKLNFEKALSGKLNSEIVGRNNELKGMESKIQAHSELIQKLTKEITEYQIQMGKLKNEIIEEENKLTANKSGYMLACSAVINKIVSDIQKIQSTL